MDYIKEAKEFLEIMHRQDWMDDNDWQEFLSIYDKMDVFDKSTPTIEEMAEALKKGVENGYSVERQKEIAKAMRDEAS